MNIKRILTPLLITLLLFSLVVMGAPNYGNVGPTTEFGFDIKIEDEIVAEGSSADDHETTIFFTDPTVDRTITVPDSDQTVGTATSVEDNSILEVDLKAVDESADEDILTKEDTTGDFEWHSAAEIKALMSLDLVANLKVKLDATEAPDADNDVDEGYTVGSRWFDVTNDKEYVCLDNTDGAAVWTETTGTGAGYTDLTEFVDQTAWRLFYSNNLGDVIELAFGTDGQYLKSTGATSAPIFDDPAGAGDMLKATYDNDEDGDIDVAAGGTEKSSWTLYAIPYLSGTTVFGEIPIGTVGQVLKVGAGATGYEFADESDPTVDTDAEIKAILVDEVIKTGDFTAGRIAKINNATGIIEQGTNADTDVADAVTKKHSQNTDTDLDATFEATFVKKTDNVNVLNDITSPGANIEDAVTKKHTQNTDTQFDFYNALGSDHLYSGDKDTQLVGESVVFGDLLYFNWTDKEWKKTDADAAATMPGLRIALETKSDGQTCLMLVKGYIRDDSAFEFAGSMVYTSVTPGAMSSTAPTETGDQVQRVGVAKSADILFFNPSIDVGEI